MKILYRQYNWYR